jgi:hypothetical protein
MTAILSHPAADLANLGDAELAKLVQSLPRDSAERDAACEKLIGRYESLVRACAQRYRHSPESPEELMQVGYVGLLKAINNFDPAYGSNLASTRSRASRARSSGISATSGGTSTSSAPPRNCGWSCAGPAPS